MHEYAHPFRASMIAIERLAKTRAERGEERAAIELELIQTIREVFEQAEHTFEVEVGLIDDDEDEDDYDE